MQIQLATLSGRKWESDSTVRTCQSCHAGFSLKTRKHHCRNCGRIFCHPCSSQSCPTPASKKPVRVCDSCFTELAS
jgi:hypothetical protein